jgi:hypothetical protein
VLITSLNKLESKEEEIESKLLKNEPVIAVPSPKESKQIKKQVN